MNNSKVKIRCKKYREAMIKDGRVLVEFIKVFTAVNRGYVPLERLWVTEDTADALIAGGYVKLLEDEK